MKILKVILATLCLITGIGITGVKAAVLGEQKLLIVNLCFSDGVCPTWTPAQEANQITNAVNPYYAEVSNPAGTLANPPFFTPTSVGIWTLSFPSTDCAGNIVDEAVSLAAAHGIDANQYGYMGLAYPNRQTICPADILRGSVGPLPLRPFAVSWIPGGGLGSYYDWTHELGHNIRQNHSHSIDTIAPPSPILNTSSGVNDVGWYADIMGTGPAGHINLFHKWKLGWASPQIVTVAGNYTISPVEATNNGLMVLRSINPTTGLREWIVVERRVPLGYDSGLNILSNNYKTGIVISIGEERNTNPLFEDYEIDLTPGDNQRANGALQVGGCWTDPVSGIAIGLIGQVNGADAVVSVSFSGGCASPPPSNNPPVANNDNASVSLGQSILINVLANDTDPENDTLTIQSVTQPSKGTVTIENNQIRYTAPTSWHGKNNTTSFIYTINDGHGNTATATVTITKI